ncbi:MAG: hypothetical protein AMJ54_14645 [Deltaproteobacteria bacterium SG8_13]|nr:MAG: hypothetical protein AMJ54_14645 [Deltaproteobacteria bacterium SG8_13]
MRLTGFALFAFLLVFAAPALPAVASGHVVFGPQDCAVGPWHLHLSLHRFAADSPAEAVLQVEKTTPGKKLHSGVVIFNRAVIPLKYFLRGDANLLRRNAGLQANNRLAVFLWGRPGASIRLTVLGKQSAPQVTLSADPQTVTFGQSTTLAWSAVNAESCEIQPDIGGVDPTGTVSVIPQQTTTYTITATGSGGSATAAATVTVEHPPPAVQLSIEPAVIFTGQSAQLRWQSEHADSVDIQPSVGTVGPNGSRTIQPKATTTYTIVASGPGGSASAAATVTVQDPLPLIELSSAPTAIYPGGRAVLAWTVENATQAFIDNGIGPVGLAGSQPVAPRHTTTYTLTATGPYGTTSAAVTVQVLGRPAAAPEGSFAAAYADQIPADATVFEYDTARFALIAGQVLDVSGQPLAGASVTILDHPGYGTTLSDIDGRFAIPVEGGRNYTLVYQMPGLLTAHRRVRVNWQQVANAPPVRMIGEDPAATLVAFDGNADTVVTHRSTPVADGFGSRSLSMVFTGDNRAVAVDEYGSDIMDLSAIGVRATEYPTPESMPAELPPASAFTYCAELSVDGVARVRFDKPVTVWVDNFLGFEVGGIVPVGFYDRDRGQWVAADNGTVVRLLDTSGDGTVDALDSDGDGAPDDLNFDGRLDDEVKGLQDPDRYPPGATFWRVSVSHFTPWDCNWPYGPPDDAEYPSPPGAAQAESRSGKPGCRGTFTGSYINPRSRSYHDDIKLPGTNLQLHFSGDRLDDQQYRILVPVTGEQIPDNVEYVLAKMEVAGRTYQQQLPAAADLQTEFTWDGRDFAGNRVAHLAVAKVYVGYVYGAVYWPMGGSSGPVFGRPSPSRLLTGIRARQEVVLWHITDLTIRPYPAATDEMIAEGWSLSAHHRLSPADPGTLHKGDGNVVTNDVTDLIDRKAGGGEQVLYPGESALARQVRIEAVSGTAVDAAGNLYVAESVYGGRQVIYRIDTWGNIEIIAGQTRGGYAGDDGPADQALLMNPSGLTTDDDGNLYVADTGNNRIRKIDKSGIITTVLGGPRGFAGDGGPVAAALIDGPAWPNFDAEGNLYFFDSANNRIRVVDSAGNIFTAAGNGESGMAGDGGPALEAQLTVSGFHADRSGRLFIAQGGSYSRIRRVGTDGIIRTIAGKPDGDRGWTGDGGPATEAALDYPSTMVTDDTGNLYFGDGNSTNLGPPRVRKIDPSGIITAVSGPVQPPTGADPAPATRARLYPITALAFDGGGRLLIGTTARYSGSGVQVVGPPSSLIRLLDDEDRIFADANGLGYILSPAGRHMVTVDLQTATVVKAFEYDDDNRLAAVIDRFDRRTSILRDADGTPLSIVSPDGLQTGLTIEASGHLTAVTLPDGAVYRFEYHRTTPSPVVGTGTVGLPPPGSGSGLTAKVQPEGNRFAYAMDLSGRIATASDPAGGLWRYSRASGNDGFVVSEERSAEGQVIVYADRKLAGGQLESIITAPDGNQTLYNESADSLKIEKTLPCGIRLAIDRRLDPEYQTPFTANLTETLPSGLQRITARTRTYGGDENNDQVIDRVNEQVTVNYRNWTLATDTVNSTRTGVSPMGRQTTTFFDPLSLQPLRRQVPGLLDTAYTYDAAGRITGMQQGERTYSYEYTPEGFLAAATDPHGHTTRFGHDRAGRITEMIRPDGSRIAFAYDRNGNLTELTNPAGVTHRFGYSPVNRNDAYQTPLSGSYQYAYDRDRRLTETILPSGRWIANVYSNGQLRQIQTPEGNIELTRLCGGKIGTIAKGSESITYEYDGPLITQEQLTGTHNRSVYYSHNEDFLLTSLAVPGIGRTDFGYDDDGLLTTVGSFTITRDPDNGLPLSITDGRLLTANGFNGYGEGDTRRTTIGTTEITRWDLQRDSSGRIAAKTETIKGVTDTFGYTYDALGRLQTVTKNGQLVEQYGYDKVGTRKYDQNLLRGIAGRSFAYDAEDRLLTAGSNTYSYDVDGFLTSRTTPQGTTGYTYSSRGELLQVDLPDGLIIEYLHDPLGRRIAKMINGEVVEKYLWLGRTRLLGVYDKDDQLLISFQYTDQRMPPAMIHTGNLYYLLYDQVGSLRTVVDTAGNVIKRIDYDAFGNIIADTAPGFKVPLGFAGGLHDRDTGLVRFGFRDYDSDIGRWTAKEPKLFNGGSFDLYGYTLCNPINLIDPTGFAPFTTKRDKAWSNPLPKIPSFTDISPGSDFAAPVADIVVGGIEAGGALAAGIAAGISFIAGPEFWWITVPAAGASIEAAFDAYMRIYSAVQRLKSTSNCP